jgi:superfamily I DNA/RNA helicase
MHHIPRGKSAIFVAFNKAIADELGAKVPAGIEAKTLHAIGWKMLKDNKYKIWKTKNKIILGDLIAADPTLDENYLWDILRPCNSILGLVKANQITSPLSIDQVLEIGGKLDITYADAQIIKRVWDISEGNKGKYTNTADFDDMLRAPVKGRWDFPTYDLVFVDEAQDLNYIQHMFVQRMVKPNGRVISVGDRHQAIYGFRGASQSSMDDLAKRFDSTELPLSVSYRCDKAIIGEAQLFNPKIQAREGAGLGKVAEVLATNLYNYGYDLTEKHMVLGRYNSSCFKAALRMRSKGQAVYLMGKDVVPTLLRIAKHVRKEIGFFDTMSITSYIKSKQGTRGYAAIVDSCAILIMCLEEGNREIGEVERFLYSMFPSSKPSFPHITICTIHKSKGLEAEYVYFLDSDRMPTCREDVEDGSQEGNLMYVAITRAKKEFYHVI